MTASKAKQLAKRAGSARNEKEAIEELAKAVEELAKTVQILQNRINAAGIR